jgi:hypothetical protein
MKIKTHGAYQGGWIVIAPQDDPVWANRVVFSGTLLECIEYRAGVR